LEQDERLDEDAGEEKDSENARLQKRLVQMQYLEQENQNLLMENEDLNQTLKINKDIIKSLLEGDKKYDAQFEYALAQITQENELWETRVKTLTDQRDRLQAEQLMQ
jgi:chaperonin cofactor prefoldin